MSDGPSYDEYVKNTVGIGNRLAALERRMSDLENALQFLRLYIEQQRIPKNHE